MSSTPSIGSIGFTMRCEDGIAKGNLAGRSRFTCRLRDGGIGLVQRPCDLTFKLERHMSWMQRSPLLKHDWLVRQVPVSGGRYIYIASPVCITKQVLMDPFLGFVNTPPEHRRWQTGAAVMQGRTVRKQCSEPDR